MKCDRIRQHLSAYMDNALDASTRTQVDKHLSQCKACKADLDSLKSLVGELGALDTVKAPGDFLESVHKRMEPRFSIGSLVRRFFVPVRIKIPLEFAAVAATAVLVFVILNAQQPKIPVLSTPEGKPGQVQSEQKQPVSALKSMPKGDGMPSAEVREEFPVPPPAAPRGSMEMAGISEGKAVKSMQADKGLTPMPSNGALKRSRKEGETNIIQLTLILPRDTRHGDYPIQENRGGEVSAYKSDELGEITGTPEGVSNGEDRSAKKEKQVDTFAVGEQSSQKAFLQVKDLIEEMGGRVLSTVDDKETQSPQSLEAEIPAKNYTLFIERLKILALLQTAPQDIFDIDDGEYIQAHIHFLTPE
jgi:hypothetical protein